MSTLDFKEKLINWRSKVDILQKKHPERKKNFVTLSNLPINRLYFPEDSDSEYVDKIGFPGDFPFTRGVQPTMYRGRFWTMRQYAGFATAKESNRRYRYLLNQGQTGLSIAFDLPTQIGYDSDHELSQGEVGKVGVSISSLLDMEELLEGIPLEEVSTSMTINAPAGVLLAMYIVVAEKQGVNLKKLRGTIQNDILKEYSSRGTYIFPPKPSMRIITDIFAFCAKNIPLWNTISISGYHIREAGSTAIQEVAFTLANGLAYVEAAVKVGLDVDDFAPRLSFFFNAHSDFLEEVAKYRAIRRLWARLLKKRFKVRNPKSLMVRFHTQTAGCSLTAQQPKNNIVRVAYQAMSAVLGGTQSLHTNSMDEALCLPTQEAVTIALRTQQIIAYETGVADTVDPLAGSYYIESLTDEIEKQALMYIEKIEEIGGASEAIEKGYIQKEIQEAAYIYQKNVENNKRIVVGVNKFKSDETFQGEILKVNPTIRESRVKDLNKLKSLRNNDLVKKKLSKLEKVASTQGNLMPEFLECVRCYATLGEICDTLRGVFGEYQAPSTI